LRYSASRNRVEQGNVYLLVSLDVLVLVRFFPTAVDCHTNSQDPSCTSRYRQSLSRSRI
jgi:hypothetical protein